MNYALLKVRFQLFGIVCQLLHVTIAIALPDLLTRQQQRIEADILAIQVGVAVLEDIQHVNNQRCRDMHQACQLLHLGSLVDHRNGC